MQISIDVWGKFGCFAQPISKVERLSYPVITPSAARGVFSAIYSKPKEFCWQVDRIEVLNPIRYISFKRNEVKDKMSSKPIYADDSRTQRQTTALRDVHYRITATICPRKEFKGSAQQLYEQAVRRIKTGKCFHQPCLGLREFVAYFELSDGVKQPIQQDMDFGFMVYDIFDLHDYSVKKKTTPMLSLYHAVMKQGVIEVPPFDSKEVLKGGAGC